MSEENKKRIYEAAALGVPPLKMVLVHADNDRANRTRRPLPRRRPRTRDEQLKLELIIRLIESLEKK
jgi:hypothetical protein